MERRLCFQYGPDHPDAHRGEAPLAASMTPEHMREAILQEAGQAHQALEGPVAGAHIETVLNAAVQNPAMIEERLNARMATFPERTVETAARFTQQLDGIETRLKDAVRPQEYSRVLPMVAALKKPITKTNAGKHRYAHADGGVNFGMIEQDRKDLTILRQAFPQAEADLLQIDQALDILHMQDDRYEMRDFQNQRKHNKLDAVVGDIGKKTGVLLLFAVAVLTGIPAIVEAVRTGKVEFKNAAPPILALAVMGLIASPHLRRQIFASSDRNTMTDVNAALNNEAFRDIVSDYTISGDAWARVARTIMEKPSATKTYLAKLKKNGNLPQDMEKDTNTFVRSLSGDPAVQQTLHQMILDGRFADFIHMLGGTTTPDARRIIEDYIKLGSQQSLAAMRTQADQINRATT